MRAPLTAQARLALHLGCGALLMVAAAWLFGAIAEDVVTSDRLTLLDAEVAQWLHRHATARMTELMFAITQLHSTVAVSIYTGAVVLYLYSRRQWRRLVAVFVCIAGGLTLNVLMKLAFHRARPVFEDPLLTLSTYSFPSGHVAGSTLFYGLGVVWVFTRTRRPLARALALLVAVVAIGLVALSRMYLGVHYLSDVVAAFAEGVAWLALCLTGLATFWREAAHDPAIAGAAAKADPAR